MKQKDTAALRRDLEILLENNPDISPHAKQCNALFASKEAMQRIVRL